MTTKKELKERIKDAKQKVAELEIELGKWKAELAVCETALNTKEIATFLAKHNAPDLYPGTYLAISESFYKLMEERRYGRDLVDHSYGHSIKIDYVWLDEGTFGIKGYRRDGDSCSVIGGIPLNVIVDMYYAVQKAA